MTAQYRGDRTSGRALRHSKEWREEHRRRLRYLPSLCSACERERFRRENIVDPSAADRDARDRRRGISTADTPLPRRRDGPPDGSTSTARSAGPLLFEPGPSPGSPPRPGRDPDGHQIHASDNYRRSSSWSAPGRSGPGQGGPFWLGPRQLVGRSRPTEPRPVRLGPALGPLVGPAPDSPYHPT